MSKKKKPMTVESLARKRPTGLDGTYTGTCIACLRATDTALGFRGEPEWHAAGLVNLGMPKDEAIFTDDRFLAEMAAKGGYAVEDGRYDMAYTVCSACARKAGFPAPVIPVPGQAIPTIGPRETQA